MDITEIISKQIDDEAKAAAAPEATAPEDIRQMVESAVSQAKAEMQAQIDAAKARADELEQKLHGLTEKPLPADPGSDTGGENNG